MCKLEIHPSVFNDIEEMMGGDEEAAQYFILLFQELGSNHNLLERLSDDGYVSYEEPEFNIVTVRKSLDIHGVSLWRIKPINGFERRSYLRYRVLYTYNAKLNTYYILGIMPRRIDYEPYTQYMQRVFRDYDDLGLPRYKVH